MPFTAGGGVRSNEDVRALLHNGADKVSLNSAFVDCPEVVESCANEFGVQCIVASIDARAVDDSYEVFISAGTRATGMTPVDYATRAAELGAGEILLTSMDRDGTMEGYDLALLQSVCEAVDIPVIACGGAGSPAHFVEAVAVIEVSRISPAPSLAARVASSTGVIPVARVPALMNTS